MVVALHFLQVSSYLVASSARGPVHVCIRVVARGEPGKICHSCCDLLCFICLFFAPFVLNI